ncbi:MAG: DNA sulfur modification protein DndE [Oscillospiraceae bacterium]|nr:DNA sulfur modification protein DndE [Oscillospiraceae bacterium]
MIVKQIKLSNSAKDKLARLKGKTGIQNWNVLCRWAFCFSLKEGTIPTDIEIASDSNVEMSWLTFAGEHHEIYEALIKEWCIANRLGTDNDVIAKYLKLHIERGINYLSGTNFVKDLKGLLDKSLGEEK